MIGRRHGLQVKAGVIRQATRSQLDIEIEQRHAQIPSKNIAMLRQDEICSAVTSDIKDQVVDQAGRSDTGGDTQHGGLLNQTQDGFACRF
ncbi:hypothetical protein [Microvirga sp. VF16]|uniref:hypothetical protein n=1 Tax=Microvirga sp. VF16 TaxID=2807101 RepID=UPI00193DFCFF|nr:hypothetical protein [Microvirga sp. VF16]QRM32456.1 hypothetical protein JO965_30640 [Microvirga sp. VF16]